MADIDYKNDFTIYNSVREEWLEFVDNLWPYPNEIPDVLKRAKSCTDKLRAVPLSDKKLKRMGVFPIWELAVSVLRSKFKLTEEEAYNKCKEAGLIEADVAPVKREIVIWEPKIYTERGITYMFQSIVKKSGSINFLGPKVTAKHKWLIDVMAHLLGVRVRKIKNGTDSGEGIEIVIFTDDDVRKITGRYDISGLEIKQLFEELVLVQACGESQIWYDNGLWVSHKVGGPLFAGWSVDSWGIASKRTGIPAESKNKHKYMVNLNTQIGAASVWNLLCGKVLALPRKKFYSLKPQEQEIYRYFAMHKGHPYVQLNYTQICKLLELSITARYPDRQIERICGWLNNLEAVGLLSWEKAKQGRKTIFSLSLKKELKANSQTGRV
jgi:hypothetical protein